MKIISVYGIVFLFIQLNVFSQCEIKSKIGTDGTLYYFMGPDNFYYTSKKQLSGGIITDKEYYYVSLFPKPIPSKKDAKKMKDSLIVRLSNDKEYKLGFYYSDFEEKDTLFNIMYLIDKELVNYFLTNEVDQMTINMMGEEGARTYNFKLHKGALKRELSCFINEQEDENSKKNESKKKD